MLIYLSPELRPPKSGTEIGSHPDGGLCHIIPRLDHRHADGLVERDERSHYRQCNGEHQHIAQYRLDAEEGRLLLQGGIKTVVCQLCRCFEAVPGREGVGEGLAELSGKERIVHTHPFRQNMHPFCLAMVEPVAEQRGGDGGGQGRADAYHKKGV